jgi:hypothetical protein
MSKLKLWLISQDANNDYDTYDSAVVAAATEDEARHINPDGNWGKLWSGWCNTPEQVTVKYIGIATEGVEPGIVLSSFNAG